VTPELIVAEVAAEVAVAELVWNAIDADATEVRITSRTNIDAPPDRLRVVDNGTGIPAE
jgi:DNA mismatch repair ATPase MutL